MTDKSEQWNIEKLEKLSRFLNEWFRFVKWQQERILERLNRYNNTETIKSQLAERGDLTPYQHYKITTVSKFLIQALDQIKSGNYSICTSCKKVISVQRLLLVPAALRCMNCEGNK